MSNFKSIYLTNSADTQINTVLDTEGYLNLSTSMLQNVVADANNSSTANIATGDTWSGVSTSTLGVVGLQFSLKTDQNCTIYIDQSPDGTNWDLTSEYDYIASKGGNGWTTQALNSYVRARVANVGFAETTYFRAQMALCSVVEALPKELSDDGRLKTEIHISDSNNRHAWVTQQNELLTSPVYRLVGTSFNGENDPNFWSETTADGGTLTYDGDVLFSTTTDPAGSAQLDSVRRARFVPGSKNLYRGRLRFTTLPVTGNVRRTGAYDNDNGFYLMVSGETLCVGSRKATVDSVICNGSFNGDYGSTVLFDAGIGTNAFGLKIEYGTVGVRFFVNDMLLHEFKTTTETFVKTLSLPIRIENYNEGSTANNGILLFNTSLFRMGELYTAPTFKYIAGADTAILKYGAGTLHRMTVADTSGNATIYDGLDNTGNIIAEVDLATGNYEYGLDFSVGLYVVTSKGSNVTFIYE